MSDLNRTLFDAAIPAEKEALCARLAAYLSQAVAEAGGFHDGVATSVAALRECGHDLWSYDEEDEFEVWGPNYVSPTGPGIVVTFRADGPTEVRWSKQGER